jgi:hypothetical protein
MKSNFNLVFGWLWILLGFLWGMVMGMNFHIETWLGGYAAYKRRMYRLGHVSFFGLGMVNILFGMTAQGFTGANIYARFAAVVFLVGAVTMPVCCVLMAHFPKMRMLFALPVVSLIAGAVLTLLEVIKS